jgi:hypothetical protein
MAIIQLKNVRLSFPHLFQPQVQPDGKKSHSANFLMTPDHPAKAELDAAIKAVASEKWAKKGDAELAALVAAQRICLRDGNTKAYDGYPGNWFLSSSSKQRPEIYDKDGSAILDESYGRPYGGCYVFAWVDVWAQDNQYGKRINATLMRVQFARDGDPFTGSSRASLGEVAAIDESEYADLV